MRNDSRREIVLCRADYFECKRARKRMAGFQNFDRWKIQLGFSHIAIVKSEAFDLATNVRSRDEHVDYSRVECIVNVTGKQFAIDDAAFSGKSRARLKQCFSQSFFRSNPLFCAQQFTGLRRNWASKRRGSCGIVSVWTC